MNNRKRDIIVSGMEQPGPFLFRQGVYVKVFSQRSFTVTTRAESCSIQEGCCIKRLSGAAAEWMISPCSFQNYKMKCMVRTLFNRCNFSPLLEITGA